MQNQIPKVIHYCWFGDDAMPQKAIDCINSWKKYCPDYEIVKWDESSFDINKYQFAKEAYENKKWAFVADIARLDIIYNNGGIYLDTDVEIIKNIDELLKYDFYIGFESDEYVNTGLGFGAKKNSKIILENLKKYENISFSNTENISSVACPIITSNLLKEKGFKMNNSLQIVNNCALFPKDYFCPMDYNTGAVDITNNTFSIHHYIASWKNNEEKKRHEIEIKLNKIFFKIFGKKIGVRVSRKLAKMIVKNKK